MNIYGKNSVGSCHICDEQATTKYCGENMCLDCARKAYYYANLIKDQQKESISKRLFKSFSKKDMYK